MQGQGDRDARATTLLNLLHPNQNQQQQHQQQQQPPPPPLQAAEPNIYPISTPQPYPPSSASTTLAGSSADAGSSSAAETTTRSSISVDSLFRDIGGQAVAQQQQQQQQHQQPLQSQQQHPSPPPSDLTGSGHLHHPHPSEQAASGTSSINAERQNALLSLLGNVAPPPSDSAPLDGQQRGAPPSNQMSSSESQGRYILDQLLPGSSDGRNVTGHVQAPASLDSYRPGSGSPSHTQSAAATSPPIRHSSPLSASEQVMDPTRKSRFEYYSPFDAFSAPPPSSQQQQPQATVPNQQQTPTTRKKPVPPVDAGTAPSSAPTGSGLAQRPTSPRVQELQHQAQQFPRHPATPENAPGSRNQSDAESAHGFERPANPVGGTSTMARMSPLHYQPAAGSPSPQDPMVEPVSTIHAALMDQETSSNSSKDAPRKREDLRPKASAAPQPFVTATKLARSSPIAHSAPTYNLDMDSALHSISAAPGLSAVTPIALLKLENVYSPGTTIAVSSFIAYAMTRGRVRLIARSNGSRSLLHLPSTFNQGTSATDMVVSGSYLACVTSDGGLVIWDVPHELDENPPVPVVLHVSPPPPSESPYALRLVKWHPKQLGGVPTSGTTSGTIAVASDREVYVFNVADALDRFRGEEVALGDLATISSVITVPSPLVGFTFDVPQVALATISIDSTIMLWSIKDRLPFWTGRVPGEGLPSSIDFLEGGLLVGRKQGTVLQLLPVMSATVAATVKLNTPLPDGKGKDAMPTGTDEENIFAHVGYDPRIKTIWAAHSARASLFAVRLAFDASGGGTAENGGASRLPAMTVPVIEQIIEFPIPMQCINMAILVSSDPTSSSPLSGLDDSMTSNIGNLGGYDNGAPTAVASFAMHQGGVDQINIAMSTFEQALISVPSKLPPATYGSEAQPAPPQNPTPPKKTNSAGSNAGTGAQSSQRATGGSVTTSPFPVDPRPRSPVSDGETPADIASSVPKRPGKNGKENAAAKASTSAKEKEKATAKSGPTDTKAEDIATSSILAKDLRRVEDNLHSRIGKLLSKELDRQQQRIDDLRRADQEADFARQETILKLISTELTKNTTRVVEQAIKSEVQSTVLPALEAITKNEIKSALGNQVAKGIADSLKSALPGELERLLLRSDISTHIARTFTTNVTPLVERQIKEAFTKTLIPAFQQASQAMQVDLTRDMSSEILSVKKEIITWQSEAIRSTEIAIRDMEQVTRSLNDQIRALQLQVQSLQTQQVQAPPPHMPSGMSPAHRSSPSGVLPPQPIQTTQSNLQHPLPHQHVSTSSHLRSGTLGTFNSASALPALLSQQLPPQSSQQQPQPNVLQQQQPPSWQQAQGPPPPQPQQQSQQQQYQPPPPAQPIPTYAQPPYKPQPQLQPQPQQQQALPPQQMAPQQPGPIARGAGNVGSSGEDWDDIFLATLQRQDPRQLRDLLARCNPDVVMPAKRELSPIGQAVVLTLIHRLSESLPDLSPQDESLRAALWWLQRTAYTLNPSDPMIEAYVGPVLNTSQQILNATANRLVGYPDLQNTIAQIQRTLSSKP